MAKMKNSGVEWIGEIPEGWNVIRIKGLYEEIKDTCSETDDYQLLSVSEYFGVAPRKDKIAEDEILIRAESLEGYKICRPNDLVSNIMLAWKSSMGVSDYEGIVSPAYCVYRPKIKFVAKYFHYLFRTKQYADLFKRYSTGIIESRLRLYTDKFFSLYCQFPPKETQQKIVSAIESKTTKIDSLIANEEKQIEKLKSYKQSLITETVTKGLDKAVKMKDSGVEWIGEIPEGWKVCKVKNLCTMQAGKTLSSEEISHEGTFPVFGGNGLRGYYSEYNVDEKVLLIGRQGALCGNVHYVEGKFWATEHAVITRNNTFVNLNYFFFLLVAMNMNQYASNSAAQPGLAVGEIINLYTVLPPKDEQESIANFLDERCTQINKLISLKESKIEKLNAYKKSLIYEYVTGKKEA